MPRSAGIRTVQLLAAALLAALGLAVGSAPVDACSGGWNVSWAIAHARGAVALGQVVQAEQRPTDFTYDIVLEVEEELQGHTAARLDLSVLVAAVCDDRPTVGATALVLFDVPGQPYPADALYVTLGGPYTVDRATAVRLVRGLPPTATDPSAPSAVRPPPPAPATLMLLGIGLLGGAAVTARARTVRRRAGGSPPGLITRSGGRWPSG